jgi:hypothetical protein
VYPPHRDRDPAPAAPGAEAAEGQDVIVVFDVDSTGRVVKFDFAPTPDGGYNRKLRESPRRRALPSRHPPRRASGERAGLDHAVALAKPNATLG